MGAQGQQGLGTGNMLGRIGQGTATGSDMTRMVNAQGAAQQPMNGGGNWQGMLGQLQSYFQGGGGQGMQSLGGGQVPASTGVYNPGTGLGMPQQYGGYGSSGAPMGGGYSRMGAGGQK